MWLSYYLHDATLREEYFKFGCSICELAKINKVDIKNSKSRIKYGVFLLEEGNDRMSEEMINNAKDVNTSLSKYENSLLAYVDSLGLPIQGILVPIDERKIVMKNFEDVVNLLRQEDVNDAVYISKFITAASSGLFDAALNYLWNETVFQLRKRAAIYDIEYFYDVAVTSDKRKRLSGTEDLVKLDDSELIKGAKEIDMISDIGYKHLDYIKYMRNWASAAHPNQVEITGLQLISWLQTCIKEVINLPNSIVTIEIGRLLKNLKEKQLGDSEIQALTSFVCNLSQEKVNSLSAGLFGIYSRGETEQFVRENIRKVFPVIWSRIDEAVKNDFGIKYARFAVNGDGEEAKYAKELLGLVNGQSYLPEQIRTTELDTVINQLYEAHNSSLNNFYKEPTFAYQLERLVGNNRIPKQLDNKYVYTLVDAFITNGNGICYDAEPIYIKLLKQFNQEQVTIAVFLFMNEHISSMLQFSLCEQKYRELIEIMEEKNTSPAVSEVIELIKEFRGLSNMRKDAMIKQKMVSYKTLIK